MTLKETIRQEMLKALKARDKERRTVLGGALGAIEAAETAGKTRVELTAEQEVQAVRGLLKKIKNSVEEVEKSGIVTESSAARLEAARSEVLILEGFVPSQLDQAATEELVAATIAEIGATSAADLGRLMGALKQKPVALDMGLASKAARSLLS